MSGRRREGVTMATETKSLRFMGMTVDGPPVTVDG
jgi:hypothetical protein